MTGDTAVVAIAAKATVKNSASPSGDAPQLPAHRDVSNIVATWLVSGLTFVV